MAGTIAVAEGARRAGLTLLLCAAESAPEAALAGIAVVPVRHLAEAVAYLRGEEEIPFATPPGSDELEEPFLPDLAEVRGQERGRRALELAAAGRAQRSRWPARRARARRCSGAASRASCRR